MRAYLQVDLIEQMGPLPFNLEFFTECQDMRQLLAYLDAPPDTGEEVVEEGDAEQRDDQHRDRNGGSDTARECGGYRQDGGGAEEVTARVDAGGGGGVGGDDDGGGRRRGRNERFRKLTEEICDVVDSYGLVCFYPLNIQVCPFPSRRSRVLRRPPSSGTRLGNYDPRLVGLPGFTLLVRGREGSVLCVGPWLAEHCPPLEGGTVR